MGKLRKDRTSITHEMALKAIRYIPKTGEFYRLSADGRQAEKPAGWFGNHEYRVISILGVQVLAHRLAWFYINGVWPTKEIDHVNRIRADNRWENLREVSHRENSENVSPMKSCKQKTTLIGANWDKSTGNWKACICVKGKHIHLGRFPTDVAAHQAYLDAKRSLHRGSML